MPQPAHSERRPDAAAPSLPQALPLPDTPSPQGTPSTAKPDSAHTPRPPLDAAGFRELGDRILGNIARVVDGKPEPARMALIAVLAEGHLLIEDVPGVGKTVLARALAASVDCTVRRIQFTPDLLPSDITGVSVFDRAQARFVFTPGAVFAHLVIADEINRASPKTQSALLESMEEHQVSVDGHTHPLPHPFTVVATQNPLEMEGTYPLPEAQRDRFMIRISMGYPDAEAESAMLRQRDAGNPLDGLRPVIDRARLEQMIAWARGVYLSPLAEGYAVSLVRATRAHPSLALGASPRSTLQLVRAAKVRAALEGREFVLPDDLAALFAPVLAHRVIPSRSLVSDRDRGGERGVDEALREILARLPVPHSGRGS